MAAVKFTAPFQVLPSVSGNRYVFLCELSGAPVYTTDPVPEPDAAKAEAIARKQARPYFNRCAVCGRWVGDECYNIDEMKCVVCAPSTFSAYPCPACANLVSKEDRYCTHCGKKVSRNSYKP
ncbi:MAG: hypothetical protein EOM66_00190 [Clostridia bacterium]|nr:hypothetical protein [Candidatus Pelethousia sp.]NCB29808.1 hypothetical protein [Clostridia bacterium]